MMQKSKKSLDRTPEGRSSLRDMTKEPVTEASSESKKKNMIRIPKNVEGSAPVSKLEFTSKERSFLIAASQLQQSRFYKLKALAKSAMKNNKVYLVFGKNMTIRRSLNERGWVEKIPPELMNVRLNYIRTTPLPKAAYTAELEKLMLSDLVLNHPPDFIWKLRDTGKWWVEMNNRNHTIVNKLKMNTMWTSKQGLCTSLKNKNWFQIEGVAEISNIPRTYNSFDEGDVDDFVADFRLTSCTGLLKWILLMNKENQELCAEKGKVSLNIIIFALNRCKEFLLQKQNRDIDRSKRVISNNMWNSYLKYYYRLISKEEKFEEDTKGKMALYLAYAKVLISTIGKYRTQLHCEGYRNIWILKPGHCCRGRGIRLASKLGVITAMIDKMSMKHVIQKYIEDPLLVHETKFDIRQYYLVTSTFPLIIWMYRDCYLKFCSQKFNLKNYHESVHLTNNAVQKKYKNCNRNSELPINNMWSLERYKQYLNDINKNTVWDDVIYPGMKKCIVGIMLSCQDSMSLCRNRFELYGCDFILDNEFNPWLIEINSCPDLNSTTSVTAKICPAVVEDVIKVVIDFRNSPRASTGKFECIYKQPITNPRFDGTLADLVVEGCSLPNYYFCKSNFTSKSQMESSDNDNDDIKALLKDIKMKIKTTPKSDQIFHSDKNKKTNDTSEKDDDDLESLEKFEINKSDSTLNSEHKASQPKLEDYEEDVTPTISKKPEIEMVKLPWRRPAEFEYQLDSMTVIEKIIKEMSSKMKTMVSEYKQLNMEIKAAMSKQKCEGDQKPNLARINTYLKGA